MPVSIASPRIDSTSDDTVYDTNEEEEFNTNDAIGVSKADPNNLVEILEFLILETKVGHHVLYDEIIKIFKQLISMNQEQSESLFLIMVKYEATRHRYN